MNELEDLLTRAASTAADYRASLSERPVAQEVDFDALRTAFGGELPSEPTPPGDVLDELIKAAEGAIVCTAGPRFFGFVIGGALPAATAADVLASGWDQCAFNAVLSPAAAVTEEVAGSWLKDLLGIPATASVGFVTGGQEANTVGLAAARHHQLAKAGWDVERDGLPGAIDFDDLVRVLEAGPVGPTIVCLQAGNVNTGACDDLVNTCELIHAYGGWVHVDGAFGLWAAASPDQRHLMDGVELADSWGCDGHKWLNVPYDSGFAFCAHPDVHRCRVG